MRIGVLMLPFVLGMALVYFFAGTTEAKAYGIAALMLPLALIYIFRPQLEWWWYTRYPRGIDKAMRVFLERMFPYYEGLNTEERTRFEQRMFMYQLSKSYEARELKTIPDDFKGFIAANAVMLSFGLKEYLSPKFENIIFNPGPFVSPVFATPHVCESFEDGDFGGMLFAFDAIRLDVFRQAGAYNVVLHELTNVLWKQMGWSEKDFLEYATTDNISRMAAARGLTLAQIGAIIGKPKLNFFAVAVEHFFCAPRAFQEAAPLLYGAVAMRLNQDPVEGERISSPIED